MGIAGLNRVRQAFKSLFFYIAVIFIAALVGINSAALGVIGYLDSSRQYEMHQNEVRALRLIEDARKKGEKAEQINAQLVQFGLRLVEPTEPILKSMKIEKKFAYGKILEHDGQHFAYYYRLPPPVRASLPFLNFLQDTPSAPPPPNPVRKQNDDFSSPILIQNLQKMPKDNEPLLWATLASLNALMALLFGLLVRKLYPILALRQTIARFGDGDLNARCHLEGGDEIAFVAKEFDKTAERINELLEARALLVRNLFHELKTPITTAKLTAAVVTDERLKNRLDNAFTRIESVVDKSAWMEQLASGLLKPKMQTCDLKACVDEALSLLGQPEHVFIEWYGKFIGDNELITLAIKNLIDNAIKHGKSGSPVKVSLQDGIIEVSSSGVPLQRPFESYLVPFNHSFEGKGLGLGLWIVYRIAKLHGGEIYYEHKNGSNIFSLTQGKI